MDHDKLEALREKVIAEKMVISKDYMGARDNLLKAKQLFPALDNISSMLTVCDILCAASIKFPGCGIDCYWVLQLLPSANDSEIKSRYQKLATLLQPIKNKFPGTESALKLIRDAFYVLSDREKRSAFDLKRGASWAVCGSLNLQASSNQETTNKERVATAQSSSGYKRVSASDSSYESNGEGISREMLSKRIRDSNPTLLGNNDIDKQQEKICPREATWVSAFMTSKGNIEVDRPAGNLSSPTTTHSTSLNRNPSWSSKTLAQEKPEWNYYNFENERKTQVFEVGQIWAAQYKAIVPRRYAHINIKSECALCVTWLKPVPFTADERRWCEAGLPVACGSFDLDPEMSEEKVSRSMVFSQMCSWVHGVTEEQFEIYPKKGEVWAIYKDWDLFEWSSNPEMMEGCKFEIVEILTDYSKYVGVIVTCLVKVQGFRCIFQRHTDKGNQFTSHILPSKLYMFSHNVPAFRFIGGEMDRVVDGMFELDPLALPDDMVSPKFPKEGSSTNLSSFTQHPEGLPPIRSYPGTQSLNTSWSRNEFSVGQIWAVYSGTDVMPRRYTRIDNIVSASQVCVTFLEPHPILDSEIHWQIENLPIVCGTFRVGKTTHNLEMSRFSHSVKCQRSTNKFFYRIYPRKGEVWAMYRNWNKKWNQSDYENYECRVVEILSDFSEEKGMRIARLVEVKGCMTFFQRQKYDGFELTRSVSKTEMISFSHRIPTFKVPGIGGYGIPEGSWHLEPDALPPKLRLKTLKGREESQK